jgi:hypothetical protein
LNTYIDTTFSDSLFDGTTFRASTASARIIQIGKVVTLYQPTLIGTITTNTTTWIQTLPAKFMPSVVIGATILVAQNSTYAIGIADLIYTTRKIQLATQAFDFMAAGIGGLFQSVVLTWIVN